MLPAELKRYARPIKCLDKGHVRLVEVMGDDYAVVQAARVSYGKGLSPHKLERKGQDYACSVCGKVIAGDIDPENFLPQEAGDPAHCVAGDRGLIRYLQRHRHTTPLEMCEIKLHVRVPMDGWRQWIRHRTASVNEFSTRYSEVPLIDEDTGRIVGLSETPPDQWRLQSRSSKQGSAGLLSAAYGTGLTKAEHDLHMQLIKTYQQRLEFGVAKEQARKDLPLSTYTEAYWKIDLHNLLHFLSLRLDHHAQLEIRTFGQAIASIVKAWVPMCWEAFVDYRLEAKTFSRMEMVVLKEFASMAAAAMSGEDKSATLIRMFKPRLIELGMSKRERREFWQTLGILA
jgi:thymidylate synthase (FAD)